jgi:hypothetical protein
VGLSHREVVPYAPADHDLRIFFKNTAVDAVAFPKDAGTDESLVKNTAVDAVVFPEDATDAESVINAVAFLKDGARTWLSMPLPSRRSAYQRILREEHCYRCCKITAVNGVRF